MAKTTRIIKVFCSEEDRTELSSAHNVIEKYDSFILLSVSKTTLKSLARKYPIEDITDQFIIHINNREIDTDVPRVNAHGRMQPHVAYRGVKKLSPGKHHYIVQFIGPIKKNWLSRLKRIGAEPRSPFANLAYIVCCSNSVLKQVINQPYVKWVGHLAHEDRIRIGDPKHRLPRTRSLDNIYIIEFFDKKDMHKGKAKIRSLGIKILSQDDNACIMTVLISQSGAGASRQIKDLSAVHGVRTIRNHAFKRTSNDVAAGIMQTEKALGNSLGLNGKGEIVAVCDTGLDTGDKNNIHEDFKNRIISIKSYPIPAYTPYIKNSGSDDGPADLDSGHGTHVAGSILGSGKLSEGLPGQKNLIRGLAYEAKLVFQAVEQELDWESFADEIKYGRFHLVGIPDDLKTLFSYAYKKGARVHSNSWGGGNPGEYDAQSYQLDEFVWNKKDFCILVSAGNDGTDSDGDGKINPMSVTSPATAKNCITVGACENVRPKFNSQRYGDWWPTDYPVSPYKKAPMANNANQIVAFSSRGPTQDGRIKPDVVAPGTFILSTRSRKLSPNQTAWSPFPSSKNYFYMGGTSMATPLTSGAVAVLRQFLREWVGYASPSAALLKATLIAGCTKLSGYSLASQISDNAQGFGRVNIDAIVDPQAPVQVYFLDDRVGLHTGQSDEFTFQVHSSNHPLRIVMTYSDYPGASLVNNLNLLLIDPQGHYYVGNGTSSNLLVMDTQNNVEAIHVRRPRSGSWKLRIIASQVTHGPQEYAFVLSGHVTA
jgi:subtilisin family serine protease